MRMEYFVLCNFKASSKLKEKKKDVYWLGVRDRFFYKDGKEMCNHSDIEYILIKASSVNKTGFVKISVDDFLKNYYTPLKNR